ncbi:ABC transporter, ATP-binding protein [Luminiphilus syltensis NOR5-1B]|uniref:Probable ATP-binding protein YheS n=1 Tax=Luminiphilus syltensis NOR5-1B TaxID=565045 RepID=B8KV40_9GAMM|nr:ATP-binding cassette domain-containing protein [Luminiphilus syltensis]EED36153.1 ABC transporter, ATP-binding protein [Luminiphilus syltensis NOR5-1B]
MIFIHATDPLTYGHPAWNSNVIIIDNLSLRRGGKLLLQAASATLENRQKIALIGANGCGKSSFFRLLTGAVALDGGSIRGTEGIDIAHMAQEVPGTEQSALDYVMAGHERIATLLTEVAAAEAASDFERAAELHGDLDALDGYGLPRTAEQLLRGLGFSKSQIGKPLSAFSGGWRVRLGLARALISPSDLLLLDEPTNHLDLDATVWLQQWLKSYPGTLLMISHDRDFIDGTCEKVLRFEGQTLHSYSGGYSDYERQRAEHIAQQQASFEKQARRKAEIENFVRRFRAKATKARQAQSRIKELERMEQLAPAHVDSPFSFAFPEPGKISDPLLNLDRGDLGYGDHRVLERIELTLRPGDRIGLLGRNGAGKTTLLKTLAGELPLLEGDLDIGKHCRIGYFDQQQVDVLDMEASPLLQLQRLTPQKREQEILDFLGGFNFRGDMATGPITHFSGGEKARLALAMVVWQDPNVLVLDEPTNHLDLEMRHALEVALGGYDGALLLVSHDRHLLRSSVEQLLLVDGGRIQEYPEDLKAYEAWIVSGRTAPQGAPATAAVSEKPNKAQRQESAEKRQRVRPLKKALEQTEHEMQKVETTLAALQAQLADTDLYNEDRREELAQLVKAEGEAKQTLQSIESRWLEQQAELEALESALGL